jgi:Methyltransferase domain
MKRPRKWVPEWARVLKRKLKYYFFYQGSERFCPVCSHSSSEFLPMIWDTEERSRQNVKCPYCHSFERHRLAYLFLQKKTDLFTGRSERSVVHIAPEPCLRPLFAKLIGPSYKTADMFDPTVDLKMDICNIDFPDNSFDIIFCSHVLEHVPDDQKAMREFARTLKPNGWAVIMIPVNCEKTFEDWSITDKAQRDLVFGIDHVRGYGPDAEDRLRANGFNVTCTYPQDFMPPEEITRMGLNVTDQVYFCTKAV